MNLLGKRIIPCYFYKKNPLEMIRWQFNACRQTAVICGQIAAELLYKWGYNASKDPSVEDAGTHQYNIQLWDGIFADPAQGEYNHAWVFLQHNLCPEQDILIDVARVTRNIGVVQSDNEPVRFLQDKFTGQDTEELHREPIPWDLVNHNSEYYTHMSAADIYRDIRAMMMMYLREGDKAFA